VRSLTHDTFALFVPLRCIPNVSAPLLCALAKGGNAKEGRSQRANATGLEESEQKN
jgi:hypothetical protein